MSEVSVLNYISKQLESFKNEDGTIPYIAIFGDYKSEVFKILSAIENNDKNNAELLKVIQYYRSHFKAVNYVTETKLDNAVSLEQIAPIFGIFEHTDEFEGLLKQVNLYTIDIVSDAGDSLLLHFVHGCSQQEVKDKISVIVKYINSIQYTPPVEHN